jgi:uncharacterized membrane protein
MQQTSAPTISLRANIWIVIPIAALIAAILSANFLFLNYVHIFSSILWTGTDIFMAFLLGPVLRNVSLSTRKEVISWLMPKMVFFMPTVSAVTTTAGYFLASKMGLITLQPPTVYWISAVLIIVAAMMIQGLGILLPTNLRVYYELRKSESHTSETYEKVCPSSCHSSRVAIYHNLHNGRVCYRILTSCLVLDLYNQRKTTHDHIQVV